MGGLALKLAMSFHQDFCHCRAFPLYFIKTVGKVLENKGA